LRSFFVRLVDRDVGGAAGREATVGVEPHALAIDVTQRLYLGREHEPARARRTVAHR
jgi:hypothetical protein